MQSGTHPVTIAVTCRCAIVSARMSSPPFETTPVARMSEVAAPTPMAGVAVQEPAAAPSAAAQRSAVPPSWLLGSCSVLLPVQAGLAPKPGAGRDVGCCMVPSACLVRHTASPRLIWSARSCGAELRSGGGGSPQIVGAMLGARRSAAASGSPIMPALSLACSWLA